jgi:integrase
MQFTDKLIKAQKPKTDRYDVREGSGKGFVIRVFPSGQKSWGFIYYFEGKKKRMTFGNYPAMSLAEARKLHTQAVSILANGKDPGTEKQNAKVAACTALTVTNLVAEYLEKWAKPRKRSWKEDERILQKDVISSWGKRKVKDITRRDIIVLLDKVVDRGSPISANRTLAVVRRMFNFALERDIVEINPCYAIKAPSKENRRDRFLSLGEIKTFWLNLDKTNMSALTKFVLKLQLVTAQRKGEIVSAEWSEIDLDSGWWIIPGDKAKNENHHRVPLSKLSLSLLTKLKAISGQSRWLFPSPKADTHLGSTAIDHALRKNLICFEETEQFTPHDLRRTAASHMTALGISRLVVSKILNHVEGSVTAIYDRHSYDKEKKEALEMWGNKLEEIVNSSNTQIKSSANSTCLLQSQYDANFFRR